MKGSLDVGIIICDGQSIPFDIRDVKESERKDRLCEIVDHYFSK